MRLLELLRLVLVNIKQNKSKVFLTSLGIMVGAATIVMVIAIGDGGQQDVADQYKTLNAGTITVTATDDDFLTSMMEGMSGGMDMGMSSMMGGMTSGMSAGGSSGMSSGGGSSGGGSSGGAPSSGGSSGMSSGMSMGGSSSSMGDIVTLTQEDLEYLLFFVPNITDGAISATTSMGVLGGELEEETTYTIVGTEASYMEISNLSVLFGSFITDSDVENEIRCVVLGYDIAMDMFDSVYDAYDSKIEIDGRVYVVNGVLNEIGTIVSDIDPDNSIFMPYTTADEYLFEANIDTQFTILADDVGDVDQVMSDISTVLSQLNSSGVYSITDAGVAMEAAMESAETLSLLLMGIAVIVFIVGGIGVMNVMFVSVKERTREIGVLKALGTSKRDILMLFLIEAGMVGAIGGVVGVGIGVAIEPLVAYSGMTVIISSAGVALGFAFAIVTGTLFGFYPAYQASNLVPIEALNNE